MGTGGVFLRKIRATIEDEPTGFVWVESGKLAASGYPASRSQIEWLVKNGIRATLTLTEQPLPDDYVEGFDLTTGHVPMRDHHAPSVELMQRGVDFILAQLKESKPVVVHCLAGEGRTGCILSAYLIVSERMSGDEAMSTLRKIKPSFVETQQEKSVREFAESSSLGSTP